MAENAEDKRIKIDSTCIGGVLAVPTSLLLRNTNPKLWIPLMLFAGALFSLMLKTFIEQALKNVTLRICIFRSIRAGVYYIVGAAFPMAIGNWFTSTNQSLDPYSVFSSRHGSSYGIRSSTVETSRGKSAGNRGASMGYLAFGDGNNGGLNRVR